MAKQNSLGIALSQLATKQTVDFIQERAPHAIYSGDRFEILTMALNRVSKPGSYIELGVKRGRTTTHIAKQIDAELHGFDSFVGYPTDWYRLNKPRPRNYGQNNTDGSLPPVPPNVKLHKGFFDQTLPQFLRENSESIAFLHVDCVIYESTVTAFQNLGSRLQSGSVIVFDDYLNFWGWQHGEHRAFEEYISSSQFGVNYFAVGEQQIAVELTDRSIKTPIVK